MRSIKKSIILIFILLFMTGCLYPDERRSENQIPYPDQLQAVESAVIQFRQDQSVLPIKLRDEDTPIFRRYPVDFGQLTPRYLQNAPGNSFESGGVYQYVLVYPEEMPEVKLIDLTMMKDIQELQKRIQRYRRDHQYAPVSEVIGSELLKLDHEALNYVDEPTVKSPFHPDHRLPLYMQSNGDIIIDYSIDIQHYIQEFNLSVSEGDDLRWLLVEHSPFVPVYSRPQAMEDGQIIFTPNISK